MDVQLNDDIDLRDYQKETLEKTRRAYDNGTNRMLNVQATGMGKSISFAHMPAWFPELADHGMLVIVHKTELARQAIEEIEWVCPNLKVGLEKAQHEADPDCDVVVTSRQTLGRSGSTRLERLQEDIPFGIVQTDEAHHVKPQGQYDNILSQLGLGTSDESDELPDGKKRLSVGWTATPNRNDGIGLHHFYDEVVARYDIRYGIREGFLCDVDARRVDTDSHLADVTTRTGDFAKGELEEETNTPQRNQLIVNAWEEYVDGPALAFCVTQDHARDLSAQFRENGISAKEITAQTPKDERKELVDQYRRGVIQVLSNCSIFVEGFDAPSTQGLLMCRPTQSVRLYTQMLGRVTRTEPSNIGNLDSKSERLQAINESGKQAGTVIDFVDVTSENQDVITAPKLFGLSEDFDPGEEEGRLVQETMEEVESLVEQNPYREEEIRKAKTLEDMEMIAEEITVFDLAEVTDEIREIADFRWMQIGRGKYRLTVNDNDQRYHVVIQENQLGQWETELRLPSGKSQIVNTHEDLEHAVVSAEMEIYDNNPDAVKLIEQNAEWHSDPASDGQKSFLDTLNVDYPPGLTKGEASHLIEAKKAIKESVTA